MFYIFDPSEFFYKYWELALRLRGVLPPPIEVFYSSPLYIVFIALSQRVDLNYLNIQIIQVLLGALNCWLIYRAGMLFFSRPVGIIASLTAVFYGPFIIYNSSFLPAVWVIAFNLIFLICLGNYLRERKAGWLIGAGIFIGLSVITRPNIAIFLLFWLIFNCGSGFQPRSRQSQSGLEGPPTFSRAIGEKWRARIWRIFLLLIPAALAIIPVTGFNYLKSGEFLSVTASGGWVFYCGNNERVKGFDFSPPPELNARIRSYYADPDSAKLSYLEHILSREIAEERTGRGLDHREAGSFWFKEGAGFIRECPGLYLKLLGKKFLYSVNGYEPHDVPEVMDRANRLKYYPLIGLAVLLPLALLGLIIARPRNGRMILYLYLSSYLISFLIMYVIPRFRLPVVPVLLLFGSAAALKLYNQIREKQWPGLIRNMVIVIPLAILVNISTTDIKRDREVVRPAFIHEWRGLTFMKRGEWEKAGEAFSHALELNPGSYQAKQGLEFIRRRGGV